MHYHNSFICCWGNTDQVTGVRGTRGILVNLARQKVSHNNSVVSIQLRLAPHRLGSTQEHNVYLKPRDARRNIWHDRLWRRSFIQLPDRKVSGSLNWEGVTCRAWSWTITPWERKWRKRRLIEWEWEDGWDWTTQRQIKVVTATQLCWSPLRRWKGKMERKDIKKRNMREAYRPKLPARRGAFDPVLMPISSPSCYRPITLYSLCFNKSRITTTPSPLLCPWVMSCGMSTAVCCCQPLYSIFTTIKPFSKEQVLVRPVRYCIIKAWQLHAIGIKVILISHVSLL